MKIYKICFSPTGGTEKVAGFIAGKLGSDIVNIDLTDRKADFKGVALNGNDVAVIAVPSYGGRVPAPAAERITQISGNGARAVIVCVYGNRAYEDTLAELQDCALKAGCSIVAAVAAIAEHSIVRRYAANRPDQDDYTALNKYAEQIAAKLNSNDSATPAIPGNRPYKKAGSVGFAPHSPMHKLRPVRLQMPDRRYQHGQPCKGGQEGLHIMHALRRRMSSRRKKGEQTAPLCSKHNAEESMLNKKRM